jgi:type IV pilus assembly protein PilQ
VKAAFPDDDQKGFLTMKETVGTEQAGAATTACAGARNARARTAAAAGIAAALVAWAMAPAAPAGQKAERSRREAAASPAEGAPVAAAATAQIRLDFDAKPGVTVIGITSTSPLLNHTVYDQDATTIVVEIPSVDVADLPPVAAVGTPEVPEIRVEAAGSSASTGRARLLISRAPNARREVALAPRNERRLEVTVHGAPDAAVAEPAAEPARDAAPETRVLATPAPAREPAEAARLVSAPAPRAEPGASAPTGRMSAADLATAGLDDAPARVRDAPPSAVADAGRPERAVLGRASAGPVKLTEVSTTTADDGRVVVRLVATGPIEVKAFVIEDGAPRLVLDLPNVINASARPEIAVREAGVLRVRIAQNQPLPAPVTRVVVDTDDRPVYEVVPGPGSALVVIGAGAPLRPAMASAGRWRVEEPVVTDSPMVVTPVAAPGDLASLGRPTTFRGAPAPAAIPMREAAPAEPAPRTPARVPGFVSSYGTTAISTEQEQYTGEPISINLKDADLEDLFRLFKEISGLNVVLDQAVKGKTITIALDEVPWDQAMAMVLKTQNLGSTLEGNILRVAPLQKLAQEEAAKRQYKEAQEEAGELIQRARVLSYATATSAQQIVKKSMSSRGDVVLDKRTNTLIMKDIKVRMDEIERLLDLLDQPTRQVMIEARIVETTKDFSKSVGIQWGFQYIADRAFGNSTNFSFPRGGSADYAVNLPILGAGTLGLSFRNLLNTFALDLQISAMEEQGRARVISAPRVMVQNNARAQIESGVQIPISTTTATEVDVTFIPASLKLEVEPQITADDTVIMDISIDNNQPLFLAQTDQASISTRGAQTVVAVPNGGTTVIGGIYQVNEASSSSRVPFLSRIPLLGWLFRNKQVSKTNDELLIFLTPKIQAQ